MLEAGMQFLVNLVRQLAKFAKQRLIGFQLEVRKERKLRDTESVLFGATTTGSLGRFSCPPRDADTERIASRHHRET